MTFLTKVEFSKNFLTKFPVKKTYFSHYQPFHLYISAFNLTKFWTTFLLRQIYILSRDVAKALYTIIVRVGKQLLKVVKYFINFISSFGLALLNAFFSVFNTFLRIFTRVLSLNSGILQSLTKWCYGRGFVGEILLIPITLTWIFWPLIIPFFQKISSLYVPCGFYSLYLLRRSWKIIESTWGNKAPVVFVPQIQVSSIMLETPAFDGHGIKIVVQGKKNESMKILGKF
jgi:hypothetical protein